MRIAGKISAPESRSQMRRLFDEWKQTGLLKDKELVIQSKTGKKLIVLLSASSVKDEDDNVLYSLSVHRDITERKKKEIEVATYSAQLKSLSLELATAEEDARRRIAVNLHDSVGLLLSLSKKEIGWILENVRAIPSEARTPLQGR